MSDETEPIRVMALHALAYCERLFYLEEVEEIRVADAAVYSGRTLHERTETAEEESGQWVRYELTSETLGLTGKVDCLRRRDGGIVPYEHKRGRSRQNDGAAAAWDSDIIQVSAYGMLIEEQRNEPVEEGRIRYHADNVTVRVPLDAEARAKVIDAVNRARELQLSIERPPVAENDRLCTHCSLSPVCLPEEERLAHDPDWEPVRLFPPSRSRKTVHVSEPGARISRAKDTLVVTSRSGEERKFPVEDVGSLVLHGYPQITTQAVHFCAARDIAVHWISGGGRYVSGTAQEQSAVQRRIRQYRTLTDIGFTLGLARRLVGAKIDNTIRYVMRASRSIDRDTTGIAQELDTMRSALKACETTEGLDVLRGHEGIAGRAYFAALPTLLRDDLPETMRFDGRNRRPPTDRFNALLGFGYALLYQAILQAVHAVGLEPALGFYHQPRSSGHPLVLDLMELFRLPLWDVPLIGSVNRKTWHPDDDFEATRSRVWLSDSGRRKAIKLFEERLEDTWNHPVVKYSLSYERLLELETRLLEKEWCGSPGMFAQMRLR